MPDEPVRADLLAAIERVRLVAEGMGLEPILIGGLASRANAVRLAIAEKPRPTEDADFAVEAADWSTYLALRER